jgi:hypothetical protein
MDLLFITQDKLKEDSGKLDALAAEIAECRAKLAKETVDAKRGKIAEQLAALVTEEDALRKEMKLIEADINKPEDAAAAVDPEMRRKELKARLPEDVERDKLKKLIAREIALADQLGRVHDGDNPADSTPYCCICTHQYLEALSALALPAPASLTVHVLLISCHVTTAPASFPLLSPSCRCFERQFAPAVGRTQGRGRASRGGAGAR